MKKLILTPQKDTLTICLPQEWVGKPLVCILRHPDEKSAYPLQSEFVSEVRESRIGYDVYRYKQKRSPRKKRLRKKKRWAKQAVITCFTRDLVYFALFVCQCRSAPMRCMNSWRVFSFLRNAPVNSDVVVTEFCFWMPRMDMQRC